jgi:pyruvate kinase
MCENLPNTSSVFAAEGTAAHELSEKCLVMKSRAIHFLGKNINGFIVDEDMAQNVQNYVDYVLSVNGSLLIEQKVDFSRWVHEGFGTSDAIVIDEQNNTLHVIDLKYGKGVRINLPSLTEKDRLNIVFAIENNLDFIAHSFVRNKQDLLDIQNILDAHNSPIKIISKIENQEGVDNIDEILEYCYGVMIARGDLGIEVAQEKIPGIQRRLIRKCVQAKKPVIVATQMLHSMIKNPRPTRAEVTDIANAIYYRTDALMLSGETAYGKYPIESVRTMAKIAKEAEKTKLSENDIPINISTSDITSFLANAANEASVKIGTKAIITDTYSGKTARHLAAYRGTNPILSICYIEKTTRELALSYGVFPVFQTNKGNTQEFFIAGLQEFIKNGILKPEDYVSYLSGSFGEGFGTTFLEVNRVDKILESREKYILPNF